MKKAKRAKNGKKKALLDNKRVVLVLSFIVAVLAWVVIGGWIKPNDTYTIDNVVIDYARNSSNYKNRDLEIVGDVPETVSVVVSGDGNVLLTLVSSDVVVYPDYSAVNDAGTYEIPLRTVREGSGFAIEELSQETVTLQFEKVQRTAYTLNVQADGITAENGFYRDEPVPTPLQVEVSGPEGEMAQIASAAVVIEDTAVRNTTYTASDADVVLLDKNGEVLQTSDLVTISPSVVTVEIPILPVKEIPLSVGITGQYSSFDSAWFEGLIKLTSDTIRVAGEAVVLDNLDALNIGDIDISTFGTYASFDINLPEGLKNLDGLLSVGVTLDNSGLSERTFEVPLADIQVVNGPDDIEITPVDVLDEDAVYQVTLVGEAEVMTSLLADNIAVQIDASAVDAEGDVQQTLPVRVYVPRSGRVYATGVYDILCDINEVEEEADASGS